MKRENMRKWAGRVGVAAALLVPALVVAQQQRNPPPASAFDNGDVLTSQDMVALRNALADVIARVNGLQGGPSFGPAQSAISFTNGETGVKSFTPSSAGIATGRGSGSNFATADLDLRVGGTTQGRSRNGNSITVAVPAGVTLEANMINFTGPASGSNSYTIFFTPLTP